MKQRIFGVIVCTIFLAFGNGVLAESDHPPRPLNGPWTFYPNTFLVSDHQLGRKDDLATSLVQLPGSWRQTPALKERYQGHGTYLLQIETAPANYGIFIDGFFSNYRLFATSLDLQDITLMMQAGRPASSKQGSQSELKRQHAPLPDFCLRGCFLIIETSDYHLNNAASFSDAPLLGLYSIIQENSVADELTESLTVGMLIFAFLFNLGLFLRHREDLGSAFLSMFVLLNIIRYAYTYAIPAAIGFDLSGIGDLVLRRLGFMTPPLIGISFAGFFTYNFPDSFSRRTFRFVRWIYLICFIILIFVPFQYIVAFTYIQVAISLLYCVYASIAFSHAIRRNTDLAWISFLGFLVYTVSLFNSFFVAMKLYDGVYFVNYGLLFFVFVQSQIVGLRFAKHLQLVKDLNSKLLEQDRLRTAFFHNTSHELRTPLHGMIGYLEILKNSKPGDDNEKGSDYIKKSLTLAEQLKEQINAILDLARSQESHLVIQSSSFNLWQLRHDVEVLADGLSQRHTQTRFQADYIEHTEEPICNDYHKVMTIIRNLLSNAFKFAKSGQENFVHLTIAVNPDHLHLSVQDQGIGIPEHLRQKIFEPFVQVHNDARRNYEGTGIGLSLLKELVDLLGGRLELESQENKGTLIRIDLPHQQKAFTEQQSSAEPIPVRHEFRTEARLPDSSEMPTSKSHPEIMQPAGHKTYRLLVVDDNPYNCEIMGQILIEAGYDVHIASGGRQAIDLLETQTFDLMLLDLMMPEISGEDVLQRIRSQQPMAKIPVVIITARASEEDRLQGLSLGADDYIAKPVIAKELLIRVANLLDRSQLVKSRKEQEVIEGMLSAVQSNEGRQPNSAWPESIAIADYYLPAENTGGDWYGFEHHRKTDRFYLCLGDVTGHGVFSALVTLAVASALGGTFRLLESQGDTFTMEESLYLLRQSAQEAVLISGKPHDKLMTMVFIGIDLKSRNFFYLNAGHQPVLIRSEGQFISILEPANPLGMEQSELLPIRTIPLTEDFCLFAYTDGLIENQGPGGKHLKSKDLAKILKSETTPDRIKTALTERMAELWLQTPLEDDVSFVCTKL